MIHYITTNGIGNAWVANELHEVQRAGIPFTLHTMRAPEQTYHLSDWAKRINEQTRVLYPLSAGQVIGAAIAGPFLFGPRFFGALCNALFGKRESMRARLACLAHLCVACCWARRLRGQSLRGQSIDHIHSQWAHSCASIGMYGAWLANVPFSFTGHATDLFRDRVALRDKIRRADFIICISEFHRQFFLDNGARPEQLHIVYCGVDTDQFTPGRRTRRSDEPLHILSSGRLVDKKGFCYLIDACALLRDRGIDFTCTIAGTGPLLDSLREQVGRLKLDDLVTLTGQLVKQEDIPAFMHSGDVYALPCVWASDRDVDGLPQMLMEAMACGVPAISTRLVGIPDLVVHERTGLLVEPNDAAQLADAIVALKNDPVKAARLAEAGRRHVLEKFKLPEALRPLIELYRIRLEKRGAPSHPLSLLGRGLG